MSKMKIDFHFVFSFHYEMKSLPYGVFVQITEKLYGKDLFNFYICSVWIKEKCDRAFVSECGIVIKEFVFAKKLEQIGIPVRANPRQQYLKLVKHEAFFNLHERLQKVYKVWQDWLERIPSNLYKLIYHGDTGTTVTDKRLKSAICKKLRNCDKEVAAEEYFKLDWADILIRSIDRLDFVYKLKTTIDIPSLHRNVIDDHLNSINQCYYQSRDILSGKEPVYSISEIGIPEDVLPKQIISESNHIFSKTIASVSQIADYSMLDFRKTYSKLLSVIIEKDMIDALTEKEDKTEDEIYILEHLDELLTFTEDELDYVCYLHYKVITGQIPVLEPFNYKILSAYQ